MPDTSDRQSLLSTLTTDDSRLLLHERRRFTRAYASIEVLSPSSPTR
jgi:hypothetical protein